MQRSLEIYRVKFIAMLAYILAGSPTILAAILRASTNETFAVFCTSVSKLPCSPVSIANSLTSR
jgi:hypothetical protein